MAEIHQLGRGWVVVLYPLMANDSTFIRVCWAVDRNLTHIRVLLQSDDVTFRAAAAVVLGVGSLQLECN